MGFINSIGNVFTHKKEHQEWEKEKRDELAQRRAYANLNQPSKDEFEKSKKEGKVIIDVINSMDAHSEDVAENVETALAVPQSLIPGAATFGSFALSGRFILMPQITKLEDAKSEFFNSKSTEMEGLIDKVKDYAQKNNIEDYELKYFSKNSFESKNVIEKLKNHAELDDVYKKGKTFLEEFAKDAKFKSAKGKIIFGVVAPLATIATSFVASTLLATKLQVNSSRVARWQSREDLKDAKHFVQFTDEQVAQAKANLEGKEIEKEEKEHTGIMSMFQGKKDGERKASIIDVIKDNNEYKEWKKNDSDDSKLVTRELSAQELEQAQKDQEVIQRVVKAINDRAEDYSENMEVLADTLIMGTPFLGAIVGKILGVAVNKSGVMDKTSDAAIKKFAKNLDEAKGNELTEVYSKLSKLTSADPEFKGLSKKFRKIVLDGAFEQLSGNFSDKIKAGKKLFTYLGTTKGGRGKIVAAIGSAITGTVGLVMGLKLQKSAARAGRYNAKQELENNPDSFIGYSNEQLKTVENVKAEEKSMGQKFKEYISFGPNVIKQYIEYKNYTKTEMQEEKALRKELIKLDVTDEQLQDAKNMQAKLFNTFEKVDDKSQEYSESVEAAAELAKPVVAASGIAALLAPLAVIGIKIATGKLSAGKVTSKISEFLSKHTDFLKGKTMTKYTSEVQDKIPNVVKGFDEKLVDDSSKAVAQVIEMAKNSALDEDTLKTVLKSSLEGPTISAKQAQDIADFLPIEEITKMANNLDDPNAVKNVVSKLMGENSPITKAVSSLIEKAKSDPDELAKFVRNNKITSKLFNGLSNDEILDVVKNLEKVVKNLPKEQLEEIISVALKSFLENPAKFMSAMKNGQLKEMFITKGIKNAAIIAGASYTTLNILGIFAVESYIASLQKRASRLGTMKALEELEDPRYYANVEAQNQATAQENTAAQPVVKNKYLKY